MLPSLCQAASNPSPSVRQAHLDLLNFLATVFGDFYGEGMLDSTLPCMLAALGDKSLQVIEMAEEGCQEVIGRFARTRLTLILDLLMKGFTHPNHIFKRLHIRLVGTLLLNQFISSNYAKGVRFYGEANNSNNVGEVSNVATVEQERKILEVITVVRWLLRSLMIIMFGVVDFGSRRPKRSFFQIIFAAARPSTRVQFVSFTYALPFL